jgi:hypothetical protein
MADTTLSKIVQKDLLAPARLRRSRLDRMAEFNSNRWLNYSSLTHDDYYYSNGVRPIIEDDNISIAVQRTGKHMG